MDLSEDVVFFLGAGVSLAEPARVPLFRAIRDACAKRAGTNPRSLVRHGETPPRLLLLDHVIPEVFFKELSDAGYRLRDPLARLVSSGSGPNAVHDLAARLIGSGGVVWTTNWDCWIEVAGKEQRPDQEIRVAVAPEGDPSRPEIGLYKLHGTASHPESLRIATSDIMRPLRGEWHDALVQSVRGKVLCIVGYAGADVDLYPPLAAGIAVARAAYWFEGTRPNRLVGSGLAAYERWRFRLSSVADPGVVPASGAHLVWCGEGTDVSDPSEGLLLAFGVPGRVSKTPSWSEQLAAADGEIRRVKQASPHLGSRLLLSARVCERLGRRWAAALRHAAVIFIGRRQQRFRSIRSIGQLMLLRTQPLRTLMVRIAVRLSRNEDRAEFLVSQAGGISHDPQRAERIAEGTEHAPVDAALTIAAATRWAGDLQVAERIARDQFRRALAENLSSPERDWPERVSRACFEVAQSLLWQGRIYEAEDEARTAYMRIAGAKWTAWEYTIRAMARFADGDPDEAGRHLTVAVKLLQAEGFRDFTPQIWCERAACARECGDLVAANRYLEEAERIPRKGPGSLATVLAEKAEMARSEGRGADARATWDALTESTLPLWSSLGHLRLAEQYGEMSHADIALARFQEIHCEWGILRSSALLDGLTEADLSRRAATLGPVKVFRPGGPWLF